MGGKGTHDYNPNVDRLVKQVDAALAHARAKKRRSVVQLTNALDKVRQAKAVNDTAVMELGEAADMLYRAYKDAIGRHDAAVMSQRMAAAPAKDIVVRENGIPVKTFGEDDIVEDVMWLIETDILSHTLDSDEQVLAAASDWITRLTRMIGDFIRDKSKE